MIYDCFMFNNELDLLDIRLNQHSFVDKFILLEFPTTYMGKPKPLYYNLYKNLFTKFADKIIYITADIPFTTNENWAHEHLQRNKLKEFPFNQDDIIIYSDSDEILIGSQLIDAFILSGKPIVSLQMELCFYYFDLRVKEILIPHNSYHLNPLFKGKWHMGKIFRPEVLNWYINMYEIRTHNIAYPFVIPNSGWHFSNTGSAKKIYDKMMAISHAGEPVFKDITLESIRRNKMELRDVLGRDGVKFEIFTDLPEYVLKNKEQFREYFYNP